MRAAAAGDERGAHPRGARHQSCLDSVGMPPLRMFAPLEAGPADAPAIGAPRGVKSLLYRDLQALARRTVETLNSVGIGRGDRVAIVLHNGPEMASSFLCIAAGAATAPLNPGYREKDLEFYLGDLQPKALVLEAGGGSPGPGTAGEEAVRA